MKISIAVKGFDMALWYKVKQRAKELELNMPEMLEKIVREWLREN